ncbi:MAG TPA: hypothetical protein PK677_08455 [Acidiphilium sp.]|nr:hypothetical protein [Acidiphilium sp.]
MKSRSSARLDLVYKTAKKFKISGGLDLFIIMVFLFMSVYLTLIYLFTNLVKEKTIEASVLAGIILAAYRVLRHKRSEIVDFYKLSGKSIVKYFLLFNLAVVFSNFVFIITHNINGVNTTIVILFVGNFPLLTNLSYFD